MVKLSSLGSGKIQDWLPAVMWKVLGDAEGLRRNSGIDKTPGIHILCTLGILFH